MYQHHNYIGGIMSSQILCRSSLTTPPPPPLHTHIKKMAKKYTRQVTEVSTGVTQTLDLDASYEQVIYISLHHSVPFQTAPDSSPGKELSFSPCSTSVYNLREFPWRTTVDCRYVSLAKRRPTAQVSHLAFLQC